MDAENSPLLEIQRFQLFNALETGAGQNATFHASPTVRNSICPLSIHTLTLGSFVFVVVIVVSSETSSVIKWPLSLLLLSLFLFAFM